MKTNFRASLALLIAASFVGTAITPRPANAIMGLVSGNLVLAVVGGGMIATATTFGIYEDAQGNGGDGPFEILMLIGGIVALDAKGQITPTYKEINSDLGASLGMTQTEQSEYNASLLVINTMSQNIMADASKVTDNSHGEVNTLIRSSWEADSAALSPEAYSGLVKVQTGISSAVQSRK
jgi:hypothetical protein